MPKITIQQILGYILVCRTSDKTYFYQGGEGDGCYSTYAGMALVLQSYKAARAMNALLDSLPILLPNGEAAKFTVEQKTEVNTEKPDAFWVKESMREAALEILAGLGGEHEIRLSADGAVGEDGEVILYDSLSVAELADIAAGISDNEAQRIADEIAPAFSFAGLDIDNDGNIKE